MKSNKGILTILANFSEFILQSRIAPSEAFRQHLATLKTQLQLLRSQLLPSTELIHFIVQRHSYNLKNKLMNFLKTGSLEQLAISIIFTITNKSTLRTQVAEAWKLSVVSRKQREVSRESRAHELLFLVARLFEQLHSKEYFSEIIGNRQTMRKYLIDFSIDINQQNIQTLTLKQLTKVTFNSASIDNSRQIQIHFYTSSRLHSLPIVSNRQLVSIKSPKQQKKAKNSLEATRGDSLDGEELTIRKRVNEQSILQVYDSEQDITILSSERDSGYSKRIIASVQTDSFQQFQLLIEEKDKDQTFVEENKQSFNNWQLILLQNFN